MGKRSVGRRARAWRVPARAFRRGDRRSPGRSPLGLTALTVLALVLGASLAFFFYARGNVERTERSMLQERARQTSTIFTTLVQQLGTLLSTGGVVAEMSGGDAQAFSTAMSSRVEGSLLTSVALFRFRGESALPVVVIGRGSPTLTGLVTARDWRRLRDGPSPGRAIALKVASVKGLRTVALALVPSATSDYAVYGELVIPEATAEYGPRDGLLYAVYLDATEAPSKLLMTNSPRLPIAGQRVLEQLDLGGEKPLLVFGTSGPLAGTVATALPWIVLAVGSAAAFALAALIEGMRRRRDFALSLVADLERKNEELDRSEQRYRDLVERLPLVTYIDLLDDTATTEYISPQVEPVLGWTAEEWTADPDLFVKTIHPADRERVIAENSHHNRTGEPFRSEYRLVGRDGKVRWFLDVADIQHAEDGTPLRSHGFLVDITERRLAEEERDRAMAEVIRQSEANRHQAFHDSLTDLPNRLLFHDRIEQAIARAERAGERVAVMLIDLDHFKDVNDTLGHRYGDELLKVVGDRLTTVVRKSDSVARLGGDEFGVLVPLVSGSGGALELAEKLLRTLAAPAILDGLELLVDASVGIALFPDHGRDVETLVRHADVAMYVSKEARTPMLYATEHDTYTSERLELIARLRPALAKGEIVVFYQPQADVRFGEIRSAEALVRWVHPERGLLTPDVFIPLAQHTGIIRDLTRHVLDAAIGQCRSWLDDGLALRVAVNVTGRDLHDLRFPDEVQDMLARWRVDPQLLELEITEDTILTDPVRARQVLERLAELGVRLAIDDFGTGHSSLGYLKRLPVDVLKIDRSFVLGMVDDEDDAAIVRTTIELGHNLGLEVVAEGVEDEPTWQRLVELGCDTVQGFFLGRPAEPRVMLAVCGHTPFGSGLEIGA